MSDVVPEHVNEAGRELRDLGLRLLPDLLDFCDRYERLGWELNELPAPDEDGGEVVQASPAIQHYNEATNLLAVMYLKSGDVTDSIATPSGVASLPVDVAEYPRLFDAYWDKARRHGRGT